MAERIYCADTSAFAWLSRNIDRTVLADIWDAVEELIRTGRMFAPVQVRDEIDRGWDELPTWCRQFPTLFRHVTEEVANIVGELGTAHQGFIRPLQDREEADPWVVAWAKLENGRLSEELFGGECVVVSSEGTHVNHIAQVCRKEKINCATLQGVFGLEGWTFRRER